MGIGRGHPKPFRILQGPLLPRAVSIQDPPQEGRGMQQDSPQKAKAARDEHAVKGGNVDCLRDLTRGDGVALIVDVKLRDPPEWSHISTREPGQQLVGQSRPRARIV